MMEIREWSLDRDGIRFPRGCRELFYFKFWKVPAENTFDHMSDGKPVIKATIGSKIRAVQRGARGGARFAWLGAVALMLSLRFIRFCMFVDFSLPPGCRKSDVVEAVSQL